MESKYTLEVYKKQGKPCFVVTIVSPIHVGTFFFKSLPEANTYIASERERLDLFGYTLRYDENGCTHEGCARVIATVLKCENIKIGENGCTYCD